MDTTYLIFFIIFLAILASRQAIRLGKSSVLKKKLQKGGFTMTKEIIEKMIGKNFLFSSGSFGSSFGYVKGAVLGVDDNWIEVQTKKETLFLNADFLVEIRELK